MTCSFDQHRLTTRPCDENDNEASAAAAAAAGAATAATATRRLQLTRSRSCRRTCDKLSVDIVRDLSSPQSVVDIGDRNIEYL